MGLSVIVGCSISDEAPIGVRLGDLKRGIIIIRRINFRFSSEKG